MEALVHQAGAAVEAARHVWNEKPLTADTAGARALLKAVGAAGVRVGGVPDTFLGAGLQSALRLIRSGAIGAPLAALRRRGAGMPRRPAVSSW